MVDPVEKMWGAIEDNIVFRGYIVLADCWVAQEAWVEAEMLLTTLLCTSNLRASFITQSKQACDLLDMVRNMIA